MSRTKNDKQVVETVPASTGSVVEDKKVLPEEVDQKDLDLEQKVIDVVSAHTEDEQGVHADLERSKKEEDKSRKKGKKGKTAKDSAPAGTPKVEEVKHTCSGCKFYDHETEREFHRDGIRKGLCEVRAICRAPKDVSKASGHLVKRESTRPCVQLGTYVKPETVVKETKKEQTAEKKKETRQISTTQTIEPKERSPGHKGSRNHEQPRVSSATNVLSGDAKILETNGHDKRALVKNIACPHCPCFFVTEEDLKRHLETFGNDVKTHYSKWKRAHIEAEQERRFF